MLPPRQHVLAKVALIRRVTALVAARMLSEISSREITE